MFFDYLSLWRVVDADFSGQSVVSDIAEPTGPCLRISKLGPHSVTLLRNFYMSDDKKSSLSFAPEMSAETGFEEDITQAPIRVSGFIAGLLGLLSALSFLSIPMLLVPLAAIGFGVFALRRYDGLEPVGTKVAYFGVLLAIGFGALGFGIPLFKSRTLGGQAEYFARQYLELVANEDLQYAYELHKDINNRFLSTMSLDEHYQANARARDNLEKFKNDGVNKTIARIGSGAKWELDRATRVFHQYRRDNAEVVFIHYGADKPTTIQFHLQCRPHSETGKNEWFIKVCQLYRERLVAESIL